MPLLEDALALSRTGFACHWLHEKQKRPIGGSWSSRGYQTPEQLESEYKHGNNIGFMPGKNSKVRVGDRDCFVQVVDVDFNLVTPKTRADVVKEIVSLFGPDWKNTFPIVQSGSGGPSMHVYFLSPTPLKSKLLAHSTGKMQVVKGGRTRNAYEWEIELYGTGKNLVLPPSIHPDTGNPYKWARSFSQEKLESYTIEDFLAGTPGLTREEESLRTPDTGTLPRGELSPNELEAAQDIVLGEPSGSGIEQDEALRLFDGLTYHRVTPNEIIEECLHYIQNDDNHYDEWLRMGMALHAATQGSEDGFTYWDEWSRNSSKYDEKEMRYKWKSFKDGLADGISGATLKWWAKENGWSGDAPVVKELLERVETWADGVRLVANAVADPAMKEVLMKTLAKRSEELLGDKVSLPAIKQSIKQMQTDDKKGEIAVNSLFDDWVYVREQITFCHMGDGREYDKEQFNDYMDELLYSNMMDQFDESTPPASKMFIRNEGARKTEGKIYVPGGDKFEFFESRECLNTWRNTLLRGDLDTEVEKGQRFLDHVRKLIPDQRDAENILDYLAMLVQKPGMKCMWWPLLVGGEGNGKSALSFVMREIIGGRNVAMPTNENLREKFMDWAASAQLVMIEELWSTDRLDTVEKLKPIANPTITIRPFHGRAYSIPNHMNLIANSNHEDNALPLATGNRRWYVIQTDNGMCPKDSQGRERPAVVKYHREFWNYLRGNKNQGFDKKVLESISEALAERDITGFLKELVASPAPMTSAGTSMTRNTATMETQVVLDALEDGSAPFNTGVVSVEDVKAYIEDQTRKVALSNNKLGKILKDAGFTKLECDKNRGRFSHGGKRFSLWATTDPDFVFGDLSDQDYINKLAETYLSAREDSDGLGDFSSRDVRSEMLAQYGRLKEA